MEWKIKARGHPNITAKHGATFMLTKDGEAGPNGDCIIGVSAEIAALDLDQGLKDVIRSGGGLLITVTAGGISEEIRAFGNPGLTLTDPKDLVVRKSSFVCGRTLAIRAGKSAADFSRELAEKLRDAETVVEISIRAFP